MFEIREWTGSTKQTVITGLTLVRAFFTWARLKRDNPDKVFSIFRCVEGRSKNDYYSKQY